MCLHFFRSKKKKFSKLHTQYDENCTSLHENVSKNKTKIDISVDTTEPVVPPNPPVRELIIENQINYPETAQKEYNSTLANELGKNQDIDWKKQTNSQNPTEDEWNSNELMNSELLDRISEEMLLEAKLASQEEPDFEI